MRECKEANFDFSLRKGHVPFYCNCKLSYLFHSTLSQLDRRRMFFRCLWRGNSFSATVESSTMLCIPLQRTDRASASSRLCLGFFSALPQLRIGYTSTTRHLRLKYALASIFCEHCRSSRNNPHCAPRHVIYYCLVYEKKTISGFRQTFFSSFKIQVIKGRDFNPNIFKGTYKFVMND